MQPLCVSATHIYLQQCKQEFDEQMLACTVAEISVAQALLMKAFFKRKKIFVRLQKVILKILTFVIVLKHCKIT